jgi:hypothetical protein
MTPDEVWMVLEMWSDYRRVRRSDKGRWLTASRRAAGRVRRSLCILHEAHKRWANDTQMKAG